MTFLIAEYSSTITLTQPAIGIAIRQPISPKAYIPMTIAIRITSGESPKPLPCIRGAMILFSIC